MHDDRTKLAIIGTKVLYCPGDDARTRDRVRWSIGRLQPDVVISGGAAGVDTIAEQVAQDLGYDEANGTLLILRPEIPRWHPNGYQDRNRRIAETCTHLLRIHCRRSTTYGSGWTYDLAGRMGRPVVMHCVCPQGARIDS